MCMCEFYWQSLPLGGSGVPDPVVSDGECESQLLDGHNEGLPPTLARGQGHAPVGEADRGRAGGTQKRCVGSSIFMNNQNFTCS